MTERLVSPDLRLWFIADNEDLKPIKALYGLSKSQKGNIKQLLGWKNVGNGLGDRNGRDERKKAKNWVLFHSVTLENYWQIYWASYWKCTSKRFTAPVNPVTGSNVDP